MYSLCFCSSYLELECPGTFEDITLQFKESCGRTDSLSHADIDNEVPEKPARKKREGIDISRSNSIWKFYTEEFDDYHKMFLQAVSLHY